MTDAPAPIDPAPRGIRRLGSVATVLAATVVAGALGYVIQALVGIGLAPADYTRFGIFWGAVYLVVGGIAGIQQEVARATHRAEPGVAPTSPAVLTRFALVAAIVLAAVVGALALFLGRSIFGDDAIASSLALLAGSVAYVGLATVLGVLYGWKRWPALALVIMIDPGIRLIAVLIALPTGSPVSLDWAVVLPMPLTLLIAAVLVLATRRQPTHVDVGVGRLLANAGRTVAGATATAVLVSALPLFIGASSPPSEADAVGALVFNITLTRAPLVIPVMALQSLLIVYFRDRSAHVWAALVRVTVSIAAVSVIASAAAFFLAGPIVGTLFGRAYALDPALSAIIVVTAGLTALLCATGPLVISQNGHTAYLVGWVLAAAVVIVTLFTPLPLEARVISALTLGPLSGLAVHLWYLARHRVSGKRGAEES